jgi:hypothetical protein
MTDILIDQPILIAFAASVPDVLQSCSLTPPSPPPPPPTTGVIYTPTAPGITYESLPTVTIVDTSPDQIIGCIHDTASNPQGRLNALFPSAVNGDGVVERRNNDIWVYDGALWNNVGPTPGPTIQLIQPLIPPYNETAIYSGILRTRLDVNKFNYSLELLTLVDFTLTLGGETIKVRPVYMPPPDNFTIAAAAPTISNSFDLRIDNVIDTALSANIPTILNSIDVRALGTPDFTITTDVPQVGSGIGLAVTPPAKSIVVTVFAPAIGGLVNPPTTTITIVQQAPIISTV